MTASAHRSMSSSLPVEVGAAIITELGGWVMQPEESTRVVFYTGEYVVRGAVALLPGSRLTDFIRNADDFIAVTDATVTTREGNELLRTPFISLRRDSIVLAVPAELVQAPD